MQIHVFYRRFSSDGHRWVVATDAAAEEVLVVKDGDYLKLGTPTQLMVGGQLPGRVRAEITSLVMFVRERNAQ